MKRAAIIIALALFTLPASPALAQVRIAPQVSWGEDVDLGIGGRLLISLSRLVSDDADAGFLRRLDAIASFDYFTGCNNCSYFEVTSGLVLPLTIRQWGPYVGAGVNVGRFSADHASPGLDASDTDLGLALMLGLLFPLGQQQAFAELRSTAGGGEVTVFTFGIQFGGGGGSTGNARSSR